MKVFILYRLENKSQIVLGVFSDISKLQSFKNSKDYIIKEFILDKLPFVIPPRKESLENYFIHEYDFY